MESVLRALAIYVFLYLVFRISGNRSISQITMFDFILLLIIGEATQQALLGDDFSITNAFILITTLVVLNQILMNLKQKSKSFEKITEGTSVILIDQGKMLKDRMDETMVDEEDILESAREYHGIGKMSEIKYAILERDGKISIIPYSK